MGRETSIKCASRGFAALAYCSNMALAHHRRGQVSTVASATAKLSFDLRAHQSIGVLRSLPGGSINRISGFVY